MASIDFFAVYRYPHASKDNTHLQLALGLGRADLSSSSHGLLRSRGLVGRTTVKSRGLDSYPIQRFSPSLGDTQKVVPDAVD